MKLIYLFGFIILGVLFFIGYSIYKGGGMLSTDTFFIAITIVGLICWCGVIYLIKKYSDK